MNLTNVHLRARDWDRREQPHLTTLAALPDDMDSLPSTHMRNAGEKQSICEQDYVNSALGQLRQEDGEMERGLSYIGSLRSARLHSETLTQNAPFPTPPPKLIKNKKTHKTKSKQTKANRKPKRWKKS